MEILLVLFVLVALFALYYFIAKWFYEVAMKKGHRDKKYFWICFWLSWIGYLLIIALPDRGSAEKMISDELPDL